MKKSKVKFVWCVNGAAIFLIGILLGCEPAQKEEAVSLEGQKSIAIEKGRELYMSYGCAVCHGKNGDGSGINAKKYYPPPIDFHDPKSYRHGNNKESIRNTIKFGVREERSGMPAFDHISEQELEQISSYLESLQVKEKTK